MKYKKILAVLFFGLIFLRLWLFLTADYRIIAQSYSDSRLEINTAINMLNGEWAGEYSHLTLCKNLAYPLFLAFSFLTGLSYPVCLFLLVVLAAFIFVKSIKPVIKNSNLEKIIFLLIIYSPVGFGRQMVYPYRNALVPWAILIVIATVVAIYLRRKEKIKKLTPWAITGAFFAGFFWNLREDSIWFLPFLILGFIITVGHFCLESKKKDFKKNFKLSAVAIIPILGILIWNSAISILNYQKYGIYTTEDRTKTYAAKVLGQLVKIDDGADLNNDYWVSDEALKLASEASPALNSLDLSAFNKWPKYGDYSIWALRDCMRDSGFYEDAKSTNEMYEKIYHELEDAFLSGQLKAKAGIKFSDTSGIYTSREILHALKLSPESLIKHIGFGDVEVGVEGQEYPRENADVALFEKTLGINVVSSDSELEAVEADESVVKVNNEQKAISEINKNISGVIIKVYNVLAYILFVLAIFGLIRILVDIFKKKFNNYQIEIALVLIGLIIMTLLNAFLVALWGTAFKTNTDDPLFKDYTTVEMTLLNIFEILGTYYFYTYIKDRFKKR